MELIFITGGAGQGKSTYARTHYQDWEIIFDYEEVIREDMKAGRNPIDTARELLNASGRLVITMAEVGAGLVPVSREERTYRDLAGETGCFLAEHAREVYRICSGIEVKLKG